MTKHKCFGEKDMLLYMLCVVHTNRIRAMVVIRLYLATDILKFYTIYSKINLRMFIGIQQLFKSTVEGKFLLLALS